MVTQEALILNLNEVADLAESFASFVGCDFNHQVIHEAYEGDEEDVILGLVRGDHPLTRISFLNKEEKREWVFVVEHRDEGIRAMAIVWFGPELASAEYRGLDGCPCCSARVRYIRDEFGRLRKLTQEEHETLVWGD